MHSRAASARFLHIFGCSDKQGTQYDSFVHHSTYLECRSTYQVNLDLQSHTMPT